jgi:alpha-glucosidase
MRLLAFLLATLLLSACRPTPVDHRLHSPDGQIALSFSLQNGQPHYAVAYRDRPLILPSELGFALRGAPDIAGGFELLDSVVTEQDTTWDLPWGERDSVRDHHRALRVRLREKAAPQRELILTFRAFNDGVAFRYEVPTWTGADSIFVLEEKTAFRFTGNHLTWSIPPDHDTYEHLYREKALDTLEGGNTPLTLRADSNVHVSIHEAALYDYPEMALLHDSTRAHTLHAHLAPWPDGDRVKAKLPLTSPWRTIQISPNAGHLIESTLLLNLNAPSKIADVSWIQPMKYIGIWWGMHNGRNTWSQGPRHGATTTETLRHIRFADSNRIPGVLVEGWNTGWERWGQEGAWDYVTPYSDFDIKALIDSARAHGVTLIGHHETGGDVPTYDRMLDSAFAMYASLGIHSVKTGYAGKIRPAGQLHHGQWMVRHYQRVVEVAAKYKITIDAHEPIKDTGIRRTWPNFMTREGVRGMEWNAWSEGNPPSHTTILPYTRMLSGPLDYTPGIFQTTYEPWKDGYHVPTTRARQLAYNVVLYSPLQMAADLIEHYDGVREFEFFRQVPVDWDETRGLDAVIGDYAVVARRKGQDWWLGAITDEQPRHVPIRTDFLKPGKNYIAEIWADLPNSSWQSQAHLLTHDSYRLKGGDILPALMTGCGGMAVHIRPAVPGKDDHWAAITQFQPDPEKVLAGFRQFHTYGAPWRVQNAAEGIRPVLRDTCSVLYGGGDPGLLTDGGLGEALYPKQRWLGFQGTDLELVIDLGKAESVGSVSLGCLRDHSKGIFLPRELAVYVSADSLAWTRLDGWPNVQSVTRWKEGPKVFRYLLQPVQALPAARFVRVSARNVGRAPAWHFMNGKPAWLFVDEVCINGKEGGRDPLIGNPLRTPQDENGILQKPVRP